jgi:hypothetical protein
VRVGSGEVTNGKRTHESFAKERFHIAAQASGIQN